MYDNTQKRKPKGPISFEVTLNEEQKQCKETIINNKVTVVRGKAGSGKSSVCVNTALDLLFKREVEKIILTRATVTAGEDIGFLPGGIDEKLEPYIAPLKECMRTMYGNEKKLESLISEKEVEVIPVGFLRGHNFSAGTVVVVDEAQNLTTKQSKLILTRLCKGGKIILCGDSDQCDLKTNKLSGFDFLCNKMVGVPGFAVVELKKNHRDEIVELILQKYEENDL